MTQPDQGPVAWYVDFGNEDEPNYACVGEKPDDEPTATVRPLGFLDVPEQESSALDLSQVSRITHTKAKTIAAGGDYAITGFVLTQKDGIKCIVDMDSVLWFDEPNSFRRILQSDTTSQKNDYRSIGIVYKTKDVCVGVIKESGMLIDGESIYAVSLPVQLNSPMASNKPNIG